MRWLLSLGLVVCGLLTPWIAMAQGLAPPTSTHMVPARPSVILVWRQGATSIPIAYYVIFKAQPARLRQWVRVAYVDGDIRAWEDPVVEPGDTWWYGVLAVGANHAQAPSLAEVHVRIP
jgi:hypothetical protein